MTEAIAAPAELKTPGDVKVKDKALARIRAERDELVSHQVH